MSQPAAVCRNKVQVELKAEIESLSRQKIFVATLLKKNIKKTVATLLTLPRQ